MGRYASWSLDGWIAQDFDKHLEGPDGIDRVLQDTGAYGVSKMKEITSKHDVSKRLTDSLMFITNKGISSSVRGEHSEDALDKPTEEKTMIVGSGAPHAIYREKYSGIHRTWDGHEEFVKSMKEWCQTVLGINADGPPEDQAAFYLIMEHIRNTTTEGDPFVLPNVENITKYGLKQLKKSIIAYLNSKAHKEG